MHYQPTIGLEIHIELNTKSKMFCSCPNDPNERHPNFNVCPICMGHPGTLPVINQEAIKKVIKTGLALNCQIPEYSKFDRKNYFYPDLPKGYQISQYDKPLCVVGYLDINGKKIKIRRVHLEEDTAKLVHPEGAAPRLAEGEPGSRSESDLGNYSLVDFNRAGIPLMELVTEPDITSAKEARSFAEELHRILHYLNVSDADMEKGEMRVEVNISLQRLNEKLKIKNEKLGTKVEIKNLNSFRAVGRGIEYEIKRQSEILDKGEKIIQETRGWDDVKGVTVSQREKEEAHDYRYFPEPDLPPLHFTEREIAEIRAEIPELPRQRRERLKKEYELDEKVVEIFVQNKDLGEYFEKVISEFDPKLPHEELLSLIKLATNYLTTDLLGLLQKASITDEPRTSPAPFRRGGTVQDRDFLITPENFAEFITLIYQGKISSRVAKDILKEMFGTGADPSQIITEKGLEQISDESEIEKLVAEVIKNNPKVVEDYKKGKENALQFLVGQIMAKTKGKANPQVVSKTLKTLLQK